MKKTISFFSTILILSLTLLSVPDAFSVQQAIDTDPETVLDPNDGIIFIDTFTALVGDGTDLGLTGGLSADNGGQLGGTTLTFEGDSNASGAIGEIGDVITDVNVGVNSSTVTFNADIFATQLDVTGTGTVNIDSLTGNLRYQGNGVVSIDTAEDITGVVSNSTGAAAGTLTLEGSTTVSGQVGGAGVLALADVNAGAIGSTSTFNADIFATQLDVTGTGTVNIDSLTGNLRYQGDGVVSVDTAEDITGVISNSTGAAAGTLTLEGSTTVSGQVGGAGVLALSDVNAGAIGSTSTFNADIFATQLDITGTGTVNIDSLTGNLRYQGNGVVSVDTAEDITGVVSNSTGAAAGTLTLEGSTTVSGQVGGAGVLALSDVNAGAIGSTSTFNADIFATQLDITGTGTVNIDSLTGNLRYQGDGVVSVDTAEDITGVISNSTGAAAGTLTLEGSTTVSGQVGGAGVLALSDVNAGATGSTSTFDADIFATQLDITGTGTVNIDSLTGNLRYQGNGVVSVDTAEDITGVVSNSNGAAAGTLTLEGSTTVSGQVGGAGVLALSDVNAGANGSTSTFDADIFATQLDIVGTGTTNIDSLTGNLRFQGDGVVSVDTAEDITGVVSNSTGAAAGTLTLEGSTTVSGQVGGAGVLALSDVNAGANGSTSTFDGDIFATQLDITGTGTANIDSLTGGLRYQANGIVNLDTAEIITGAVTTTVANQGTLNFEGTHATGGAIGVAGTGLTAVNIQNGTLTMDHNIAATTVTVDSVAGGGAGTLALSGDRTLTGDLALANSGVLTLGANDLTIGGTGIYTQAVGQTLNVSITNATTFGSIIGAGNAAVTGGTVNITVGSTYIVGGTTFKIIDGGAGGTITGLTYTDNSFALNFTGATAAGDLTLTAIVANPYSTVSTNSNISSVGKVLEEIGTTTTDSDMQHVLTVINSLSSAKEIEAALETLQPDLSSGDLQSTRTLSGQFHSTVSNRLSYARGGLSGIATGDMTQGAGFWVQGVGSHSSQGEREGIEGYNSNTFGTTMGFDKLYGNRFRAGLAGGYGFGSIDSKTPGSPSTDVHSFQGTLYGSFESAGMMSVRKKREAAETEAERSQQEKLWYMDSMLSFMQNKYDSRRDISFGSESRIAQADHYGQQYSSKFEAGYTFTFDKTKALEITPFTSLGYGYLYMNQYKEKGADALNLTVAGQGYHQLEQGLGIKFGYPIPTKNGQVYIPSIRGSWLYDYIGSRFKTSASFQGGGPAFETSGAEPAQSAFLVGAELAFLNKGNLTLTGNFDWELRDAYSGLTYYATLRYDF